MKQSDFDRAICEREEIISKAQAELDALFKVRKLIFGIGEEEDSEEKSKSEPKKSKYKPKEDRPGKKKEKPTGPPPLSKKCNIEGCEGKYAAKGFCHKHYQQNQTKEKAKPKKEEAPPYPPGLKVKISSCCGDKAYEGIPHDEGNMYCEKCKKPCEWIWKPPPSDR